MTKKRKVNSPKQDGHREMQSSDDMCTELKEFIARENAKCVRQIKESNDQRLVAIEESLSFAIDSVKTVSDRQNSAKVAIQELQRETEALRQRLRQLEFNEDRQEQDRRLTSLIFSGPALQALSRREEAAEMIRSLVDQYLHHALDRSQVGTLFRLRNGKVMIDFTTAARNSDRDVLFRNKSKLRGSGLFISELLTPRRHAMFLDLLQLRREGKIFSVFTRSGDILACRSRDSAPIRLADPEAVRDLAWTARRPTQGRVQAESEGEPPASAPETEGRGRSPGSTGDRPADMEVQTCSPANSSGLSRHESPVSNSPVLGRPGLRHVDTRAQSAAADKTPAVVSRPARRYRAEEAIPVHHSPPSDAASAGGVNAGGSADSGWLGRVPAPGGGSAPSRDGRRDVNRPPGDGGPEPPPPAAAEAGSSPPPPVPASGQRDGARQENSCPV